MKKLFLTLAAVCMSMGMAGAFAADEMMKKDEMSQDSMKKDHMAPTTKKKSKAKKDAMGHDSMGKKDAMGHDAMGKDKM